jgi:hypothetical protein
LVLVDVYESSYAIPFHGTHEGFVLTGLTETLNRHPKNMVPSTALGEALAQLDRIVDRLELDAASHALLQSPMREHHVALPVRMDDGTTKVFKGIRVQHNDARGPYKGGIRMHASTTADDVRALAMLMTWKCAVMNHSGREVGSDMNPYLMVGFGNGSAEAAALSARLASWHDAMVAHERKIRAGREHACDEKCPHAEARTLWVEALEIFGDRAQELTFLRSRANAASEPSEAADRGRRSNGPGHTPFARRSRLLVGSSERARTATAEL